MGMIPPSLGRKTVTAILATIPPALLAVGVTFGIQYGSAHSAAPVAPLAQLATAPVNAPGSVAFNGTVTWQATESGQDPAIRADLTIPVEGTHVALTFSKNTDASLPASHIIEVAVSAEPGSRAGRLAKVGDLIAKPSRDASGTALAASVVDVNETVFWIALSRLSVDRSANLRLLATSPVFTLPVTYASGRSAVITFAKGHTGDAVFQKVLAAWGP